MAFFRQSGLIGFTKLKKRKKDIFEFLLSNFSKKNKK